jgi:hypothetical protein
MENCVYRQALVYIGSVSKGLYVGTMVESYERSWIIGAMPSNWWDPG